MAVTIYSPPTRTSLVGRTFGLWTVLRDPMPDAGVMRRVACRCACGTIKTVIARNLLSGFSSRCTVTGRHAKTGEVRA